MRKTNQGWMWNRAGGDHVIVFVEQEPNREPSDDVHLTSADLAAMLRSLGYLVSEPKPLGGDV